MAIIKKVVALLLLFWWITGIALNKKNRDIFLTSVRIMLSGENIGVGISAVFMLIGIPVIGLVLLFS